MPWKNNNDWYPYNEETIKAKAPETSGIYGLYNIQKWVYIGEADNIREQLLVHKRNANSEICLQGPTAFTFEPCPAERRAKRREELIAEWKPVITEATNKPPV